MNTDYSLLSPCGEEKIVVCITPQSNSRRLIDKGAQIARECGGQLHILHVQKGDNIFHNQETLRWLQQLFVYGNEMGGMVHALCDEDIPRCIARFTKEEKITKVVMGEMPPKVKRETVKNKRETFFERILDALPKDAEVIIVKREEEQKVTEKNGWNPVNNYIIA